MLAPLGEAQPAEAVVALAACHVHATLVLFAICVTLRTRLCVCLQPRKVFGIVDLFLLPLLRLITIRRQVVLEPTLEAELGATRARYHIVERIVVLFDDVVAVFGGTPLDVPIVVSELLAVPDHVLFSVVDAVVELALWEVLQEVGVRQDYIASQLRTLGKHSVQSIGSDFLS